jgi:hypothetical protein
VGSPHCRVGTVDFHHSVPLYQNYLLTVFMCRGTSDKALGNTLFYFVTYIYLISRLFFVTHILLHEVNNTSGEFIGHNFTVSLMSDIQMCVFVVET